MKIFNFLKKAKSFIFSFISLLFFVFCTVGIVSSHNSSNDNVDVVIVKQITQKDLNDKLENVKLKKEQIKDQTDSASNTVTLCYFIPANVKKSKSPAKTILKKIASSSVMLTLKSVFNSFRNLFKHKSNSNPMEIELKKINKS